MTLVGAFSLPDCETSILAIKVHFQLLYLDLESRLLLQVGNAPYHHQFLPPPAPLDMVEDAEVVSRSRDKSTIDKGFIRDKQDNSTEKM